MMHFTLSFPLSLCMYCNELCLSLTPPPCQFSPLYISTLSLSLSNALKFFFSMNAKPLRSFLPPSSAGGGSCCRSEEKGKESVVEVKEEASEAEGAWMRLGIGIGATGIKQEQKVVEKKRKHNGGAGHRFQSVLTEKQWRELQEQAIIYKYIASGLPVPLGLVVPIWKSVASSVGSVNTVVGFSPQGFDNRNMMDPEPMRCRRTDGKKWRCGKHVVIGQKYCERHMHRGRLRSRKLVEASQITPSDAMIPDSSSKNSNATCSASNSSSPQLVTQKENVSHLVPSTSSCILETKSNNTATTVSSVIAKKSTGMTMNSSAVTNTSHRIKPSTTLADTNIKSSSIDLIDHPVDDKRHKNFICPVSSKNVPDRSRVNRSPKNFGGKKSQGLDFSPKSVLPVQGGRDTCSSLCQIDLEVEPWRCKRTDGKKWRCRRDAISNEKYCAMHMHRGAKKPAGSSQPARLAAAGVSTSTHPRPTKTMAKKTDCTYLNTNLSISVPASPTSASSTSSDATISDTIYADSEI